MRQPLERKRGKTKTNGLFDRAQNVDYRTGVTTLLSLSPSLSLSLSLSLCFESICLAQYRPLSCNFLDAFPLSNLFTAERSKRWWLFCCVSNGGDGDKRNLEPFVADETHNSQQLWTMSGRSRCQNTGEAGISNPACFAVMSPEVGSVESSSLADSALLRGCSPCDEVDSRRRFVSLPSLLSV